MSTTATKKMIEAYFSERVPTMFLSGFFPSTAADYYNGESVEVDIVRGSEGVSVPVPDLNAGARKVKADVYTNKEFKPPIYCEEAHINGFTLIKREPGQNPFEDPNYQANGIVRSFNLFRQMEARLRRSIELQAAQGLQDGEIALVDDTGATAFSMSFFPKGTHYPTATTPWGTAGYDPIQDLIDLCDVVREDGLADVDTLIFGAAAWESLLDNDKAKARLDNRKIEAGLIAPMAPNGQGGKYMGSLELGAYRVDCWTYNGMYNHPQTGTKTRFVTTGNVIALASTGVRRATWGGIPQIVPPDQRVMPFLPERMSNAAAGIDLFPFAYVAPNGQSVTLSLSARPLLIPVGIDTHGCLRTGL
jgi:hypothetical protein